MLKKQAKCNNFPLLKIMQNFFLTKHEEHFISKVNKAILIALAFERFLIQLRHAFADDLSINKGCVKNTFLHLTHIFDTLTTYIRSFLTTMLSPW